MSVANTGRQTVPASHRKILVSFETMQTGASVSLTVTLKVQVSALPEASVAIQVTGVVPTGKTEPEAGVQLIVAPGQLSLTLEEKFTTALHKPESLLTIISAGQIATGASVSFTVTLNVQVSALPEASVAIQVTGVIPTGKTEPEAGVQLIVAPGQLSVTDEE